MFVYNAEYICGPLRLAVKMVAELVVLCGH